MAIGQLKETQDGKIVGEISTYAMFNSFELLENTNKKSNDSPSHTISMIGKQGNKFDAGVAWIQNHANVGKYYSLSFQVPELLGDDEYRCGAFGNGKGQGEYDIVINKPQKAVA